MEGRESGCTQPGISGSGKKGRKLSLKKCDFCRKRKVKCEPQNREPSDRCDACERRDEACSPLVFATRKRRVRQVSAPSDSTSIPAQQSVTEASTTIPEEQRQTGAIITTVARSGVTTGLTYQQIKDVATVLRCHYSEYRVQLNQVKWLEKLFRDYRDLPDDGLKRYVIQNVSDKIEALSKIREIALGHVKSLLESNTYTLAERMLIHQLLVEIETSSSTLASGAETTYSQDNPQFAAHQRALAAVLYEKGDDNGALTILHRIPLAQIGRTDWKCILEICQALRSRIETTLMIMGIGVEPIMEVSESLHSLAFPYSLLAVYHRKWMNEDGFIQKSFTWPWTRRSIEDQLRDSSKESVSAFSTTMPAYFRDTFGHSIFHAVMFSQNGFRVRSMQPSEELKDYLSTACPSYAEGFTPVACSASSLADLDVFDHLVSVSGKNLCCGSHARSTGHTFCAVAFAIRNQEPETLKTLVETSKQRSVDISDCCRWGKASIPDISSEIRNILAEALQKTVSDGEDEEVLENGGR